jgi:membrane-bound lytic murein transglycosylase D
MNSTLVSRVSRWLMSWLLVLAAVPLFAAESPVPRPPGLERDVQFWIRVYTEVTTNGGFLHDDRNLAVVYEKLEFGSGSSPRERQKLVDEKRDKYVAALRRIAAANGGPLSADDQRIRDMWGDEATPARMRLAEDSIRFQLGQADRFREGLVRSGAWSSHIAEVFANQGLPAELAVLPHVESSFNPAAYSKVGAAGLWQFMRSTGRRYMRIDGAIDDRLDPFRSTEAAAQLLAYNYRLLGTWPLALTAYNHGAAGMRRAKESMGTDDIERIVRNYKSPSFGFASRNFYVSFLAALEIDHNPEKYFKGIEPLPEVKFAEVAMPSFVGVGSLERVLKIDRATLRSLNPALLPAVWAGARNVPKGYRLRLPAGGEKWTTELLAQRLSPTEQYANQPPERRYKVSSGDTLSSIAAKYGVTTQVLAQLNGISERAKLRRGRTMLVPPVPAVTVASAAAAPQPAPRAATAEGAEGEPANVYVVRRGDSISEITKKTGLSQAQILKINKLKNPNYIYEGQKLALAEPGKTPPPAALVAANTPPPASASAESGAAPATQPPTRVGSAPIAAAPPTRVAETPPPAKPVVVASASPPAAVPAEEAERESDEDAEAVVKVARPDAKAQPVSAAEAEELGPALGPAVETPVTADPIDYSVGKDDTIYVVAEETLGHYADWLKVTANRLRQVNRMKFGRPVIIGHKLKLDFSRVSREDFERTRREFHRTL